MTASVAVRRLGPADVRTLADVAGGVFDRPIDPALTREFLADANHLLVVAVAGTTVVGMATAVRYVHPDKPAELFINEIGVAVDRRGEGIGGRLLDAILDHGRQAGCREAWVLADPDNARATSLYRAAGGTPAAATMFSFSLD